MKTYGEVKVQKASRILNLGTRYKLSHLKVKLSLCLIKREEVTGGWRKLHNEEVHNLYASAYIIRVNKSRMVGWAEHVTYTGEINTYIILVVKLEGKKLLGRIRNRGEVNIKMKLRETGCEDVDWSHLGLDRSQ
jgi:hypothetical protein